MLPTDKKKTVARPGLVLVEAVIALFFGLPKACASVAPLL
jgi:hypothetical protein